MYVAMFHADSAAQKAVEEAMPEDWQVAVVGQLGMAAIERRNIKTGISSGSIDPPRPAAGTEVRELAMRGADTSICPSEGWISYTPSPVPFLKGA
jgi:hypothetical protein